MPKPTWRRWAIACALVGAVAGLLIARAADRLTPQAVLLGAFLGFLVGMYVIETIWERTVANRPDTPPSPIGKRR